MTEREQFEVWAKTLPKPVCENIMDGLSRGESYTYKAWQAARTVPDTHVLVPKAALDWLFGEHPDGFEPPADQRLFRGKLPPYWWRTEFRRRIEAASQGSGE